MDPETEEYLALLDLLNKGANPAKLKTVSKVVNNESSEEINNQSLAKLMSVPGAKLFPINLVEAPADMFSTVLNNGMDPNIPVFPVSENNQKLEDNPLEKVIDINGTKLYPVKLLNVSNAVVPKLVNSENENLNSKTAPENEQKLNSVSLENIANIQGAKIYQRQLIFIPDAELPNVINIGKDKLDSKNTSVSKNVKKPNPKALKRLANLKRKNTCSTNASATTISKVLSKENGNLDSTISVSKNVQKLSCKASATVVSKVSNSGNDNFNSTTLITENIQKLNYKPLVKYANFQESCVNQIDFLNNLAITPKV